VTGSRTDRRNGSKRQGRHDGLGRQGIPAGEKPVADLFALILGVFVFIEGWARGVLAQAGVPRDLANVVLIALAIALFILVARISRLPSFLNRTEHLTEYRLLCQHLRELFEQGP